ncbi:hypothetical protein [Chryseobacterium oryctis]|uniref:Uncharacterized protein n=1 Tax=Chryseobacterium oryctis TaxID=2952618 RepID=A0ABT3HPH4_9FLAO|nr:hypothetical protein [Chryseobacterium oryctis]MCW3161681.1 hypothetical protein [Chryseobacterium oryctis]
MKNYLLLLLLVFSFSFGQTKEFPLKNEDFSNYLMNYETPFYGTISTKETVIKLKIEKAVKNPKKAEQYLVSGYSDVDGNKAKFSGQIVFTQKYNVNGEPNDMLVFGDFVLNEDGFGEHVGTFKGKLRIQTPKRITKESRATVTFKGNWKNNSGNLDFDVWWANFVPNDISKVIFK